MKVRYGITITGHVQGVGFRITTRNIAQEMGYTGWVQNKPDGSVYIEINLPQGQLSNFIRKLKTSRIGHHIGDVTYQSRPKAGDEKTFTIRR